MDAASRKSLTASSLFHLAASGQIVLTDEEKNKLEPNQLMIVFSARLAKANQHDKDRLSPSDLVILRSCRLVDLSDKDQARLSETEKLVLASCGLL